jgi:hypothetical protein
VPGKPFIMLTLEGQGNHYRAIINMICWFNCKQIRVCQQFYWTGTLALRPHSRLKHI